MNAQIAKFARAGVSVHFTLGGYQIPGTNLTAEGISLLGVESVVQTDSLENTLEQISDHEVAHQYFFRDARLLDACSKALTTDESIQKELAAAFGEYLNLYNEDVYKAGDGAFARVLEELICDAYAGINREGAGADQFQSIVKPIIDDWCAKRDALLADTEVRYSIDSMAEAVGFTFEKDGQLTVFKDAKGNRIDKVTEEHILKSPLGAVLTETENRGFITKAEKDQQVQFLADLYNLMLNTQDIDLLWAVSASTGFQPIESGPRDPKTINQKSRFAGYTDNSDPQYSRTVDFTTICLKTQAVIDAMSKTMVKLGHGLTEQEIVDIVYRNTHEAGEPVPCPVCYVFSRWVGLGGLFDKMNMLQTRYANTDEATLRRDIAVLEEKIYDITVDKGYEIKYNAKTGKPKLNGKGREALYKDLRSQYNALHAKQTGDRISGTDTMTAAEKKDMAVLEQQLDILDNWTWINDVRLSKNYEPVPPEVLYDINAGKVFAEQYPESWKFRTTRGPAMGKAAAPYADEHLGQILRGASVSKVGEAQLGDPKRNPFLNAASKEGVLGKAARNTLSKSIGKMKAQNLMGGQRYQSTSDFRFEYATDYLMSLLEMQALGAKAQLYTKVPESVHFLASMGAEVNCSLMPLGDGYKVNKDGSHTLTFSSVTGMNAEDAFRLSDTFDNVQTIMVGVNNKHIELCLADPRIGFVIPYHASGASEARYVSLMDVVGEHVADRVDYSDYQSDKHVGGDTWSPAFTLRHQILTGKVGMLTDAEKNILRGNDILHNLYKRFYGVDLDGKVSDIDPKYLPRSVRESGNLTSDPECRGVTLSGDQAEIIMPFEYWDRTSTFETADENGKAFVEYCESLGVRPRFSGWDGRGKYHADMDFTKKPGYWKTLIDRSMYNNDGSYHEQQPINVTKFNADYLFREEQVKGITQPPLMNDPRETEKIAEKSVREVQERRGETRYSVSGDRSQRYTYEALISKPDITVTQVPMNQVPTKGKKLNMGQIAESGLEKAEAFGSDGIEQRYAYVPDLDAKVGLPKRSAVHGLTGNKTNNSAVSTAEVTHVLPEVLKNSIAVNELDPRSEKDGEYSYVLFGYAEREDGKQYLVKSTVNHFADNRSAVTSVDIYDVLKGIRARKTKDPQTEVFDRKGGLMRSHTGEPAASPSNGTPSLQGQTALTKRGTRLIRSAPGEQVGAYDVVASRGKDGLQNRPDGQNVAAASTEVSSPQNQTADREPGIAPFGPTSKWKSELLSSHTGEPAASPSNGTLSRQTQLDPSEQGTELIRPVPDKQAVSYNGSASTLSVAQLLDVVKENYPELLPESVREHYGLTAEGKEPQARYSLSGRPGDADDAHLDHEALDYFGSTRNWKVTGYIQKDGTQLDFSGRKRGNTMQTRDEDHREIWFAYGEPADISDNETLVDYMNRGNVRINPESKGINLVVAPTKEQEAALRRYITYADGEVMLDIDDGEGRTVKSIEYPKKTSPTKVLNDIKTILSGEEPAPASAVAAFRYSLSPEKNNKGKRLTQEQADYFADSKVRDAEGNLQVVYHGTANGGPFTVFDGSKLDMSSRTSQQGCGFYFTDNKRWAREYTKTKDVFTGRWKTGGDPHIFETYLNITNPLELKRGQRTLTDEQIETIIRRSTYDWAVGYWKWYLLGDKTVSDEAAYKGFVDMVNKQEMSDKDIVGEIVQWFKDGKELLSAFRDVTGHDGIHEYVDLGKASGDIWVATSPEQIKNIDNKAPTEDPDIRYSLTPVEPIQPKSGKWERGATFDEVKTAHPTLFALDADEADTRNPTQISGTVKSYRKIYDSLRDEGFNGTILDANSGLGYGTKAGREEYGFTVDDIEPFPDAKYQPMYTDYSTLDKTYDVIINNAVLNVMPQDLRDALVVKMGEMLNPGGRAFINVRGADVKNASSKVAINDDLMEYFISNTGSYQKGFKPAELVSYLRDALGDGFTVEPTKKFGAVSAIVTKKADAAPQVRYSITPEFERWYRSQFDDPSEADASLNTARKYSELMQQYGALDQVGSSVRATPVPKQTDDDRKVSETVRTVMASEATPKNRIPTIVEAVADGKLTHVPEKNDIVTRRAHATLRNGGWAKTLADWTAAVRSGRSTPDLVAMGAVLLNNAGNSNATGAEYLDVLTDYIELMSRTGKALQAGRLIKQVTPEGRLYMAEKTTQKINEKLRERKSARTRQTEDAALADIIEVRDTALQTIRDIFDALSSGRNRTAHGVPVEDWMTEVGNRLAQQISSGMQDKGPNQKPITRTVQEDLLRFAENYALPKGKTAKGVERRASDRIADFFSNRKAYVEAWNQAQKVLREQYKNDPEKLDALEELLQGTLGYNGAGSDAVMMRAVAEFALTGDTKIRDIVMRAKLGDRKTMEARVFNALNSKVHATGADATVLRDAVTRYVSNALAESGIDTEKALQNRVSAALKDIGVRMSDIIREGAETQQDVAEKVSDMLVLQYGISQEGAAEASRIVVEKFTEMTSEAAQKKLESMFRERPTSPERGMLVRFNELVNLGAFTSNRFDRLAAEKIFGVNVQIDHSLIDEYRAAKTDRERDAVMEKITTNIAQQIPATKMEKFTALRYLNMLGNLKTQIRNMMGNAAYQPIRMLKDEVAAGLESLAEKAGIRIERTKALSRDPETFRAGLQDFAEVRDIILGGGKYSDNRKYGDAIESKRRIFKTALLEKYRTLTNKAMDDGDAVFSQFAYADALAGYMKSHKTTWSAASEELRDRAREYAIRQAAEATYRDNNAFADAVSRMRIQNADTWATKAINMIGEGVMPFRKTPANILARAVEYGPLGIATAAVTAVRARQGEATSADVIDQMAKTLTGSALMAAGYLLANMGALRGGDDDDEKKAEFDDLLGHQAYSLEIGGRSYTLDWLAPEAIPLFMGAQVAQLTKDGDMSPGDIVKALASIPDPMLEMSMLQGLNDALQNAASYGSDQALVRFTGNALWSFLTQGLTSTLMGQAERAFDNTRRTTYVDKNSDIPAGVQSALGKASAKIPGVDFQQIPYIDAWGRMDTNADSAALNFLYQFTSPSYVDRIEESGMEVELGRLYDATKESSVLPSRAPRYFANDGARIDLTAEQYLTFATDVGQTSYNTLTALTESGAYRGLSDDLKVDAVEKVYDYSKQVAKNKLVGYKVDNWVAEARDSDDPALYIAVKAATSNAESLKDKNGETISNSKSLQVMDQIYSMPGLTDRQKKTFIEQMVGKSVKNYSPEKVKQELEKMKKQSRR